MVLGTAAWKISSKQSCSSKARHTLTLGWGLAVSRWSFHSHQSPVINRTLTVQELDSESINSIPWKTKQKSSWMVDLYPADCTNHDKTHVHKHLIHSHSCHSLIWINEQVVHHVQVKSTYSLTTILLWRLLIRTQTIMEDSSLMLKKKKAIKSALGNRKYIAKYLMLKHTDSML